MPQVMCGKMTAHDSNRRSAVSLLDIPSEQMNARSRLYFCQFRPVCFVRKYQVMRLTVIA